VPLISKKTEIILGKTTPNNHKRYAMACHSVRLGLLVDDVTKNTTEKKKAVNLNESPKASPSSLGGRYPACLGEKRKEEFKKRVKQQHRGRNLSLLHFPFDGGLLPVERGQGGEKDKREGKSGTKERGECGCSLLEEPGGDVSKK